MTIARTYPSLLIVNGKESTPAPMMVFMIVMTVRKKSKGFGGFTCLGCGGFLDLCMQDAALNVLVAT